MKIQIKELIRAIPERRRPVLTQVQRKDIQKCLDTCLKNAEPDITEYLSSGTDLYTKMQNESKTKLLVKIVDKYRINMHSLIVEFLIYYIREKEQKIPDYLGSINDDQIDNIY